MMSFFFEKIWWFKDVHSPFNIGTPIRSYLGTSSMFELVAGMAPIPGACAMSTGVPWKVRWFTWLFRSKRAKRKDFIHSKLSNCQKICVKQIEYIIICIILRDTVGMFMNCWLVCAFKASRYIAVVQVACPFWWFTATISYLKWRISIANNCKLLDYQRWRMCFFLRP